MDELIQTVRKFPRLLPLKSFEQLFPTPVKGNDLSQMLIGYKPLNKVSPQLKRKLKPCRHGLISHLMPRIHCVID